MRQAIALAEEGLQQGELPIAALVVLDGKIIAQATTAEKRERRLLVHAELLALEAADKLKPFPGRRRHVQLYTTLEPCLMCLGAAMSFFLGEIYYALEAPSDGAVNLVTNCFQHSEDFANYQLPQIQGGILRNESKALFQKYVDMHSSGAMWEWARSLANQV